MLSRSDSGGGCIYYESIGQTICDDESYTIRESEYYKDGVGPVGYTFYSGYSDDGGGFYTAFTYDRKVELIETNLTATDGSSFVRPPWEATADMSYARYDHSLIALDQRLYALCGRNDSGYVKQVEVYDPQTGTWETVSNVPGGVDTCMAESINGKIYVVGTNGTMYTWEPITDNWVSNSSPTFEISHDSAVISDRYLMIADTILSSGIDISFYDTTNNTWYNGYSLSTSDRRWFCLAASGTDLYLSGGYMQYLLSDSKVVSYTSMYDSLTGTWTNEASSFNTYDCTSTSFDGGIVVLGGTDGTGEIGSAMMMDTGTKTWTDLPDMIIPRKSFDAVELNGKLYVNGGKLGGDSLKSMHVYTPSD